MTGIKIDIEHSLDDMNVWLTKSRTNLLFKAAKSAMNRGISKSNTSSKKQIRKKVYRLKASEVKSMLGMNKVRGSTGRLDGLEVGLKSRQRGPTMIRFVKGQKTPRKQKGIPVSKRKPVRVEIRPGRTHKLGRAFIAKAKGDRNQVFRRKGKEPNPIAVQRLPRLSIAFFQERGYRERVIETFRKTFNQRFGPTFNALLQKEARKRGG